MYLTRVAHHEREHWLEMVWHHAGLTVLYGRNRNQKTGEWERGTPANKYLEQEFAPANDPTIYTSCLLRIKLLKCEQLQPWQVFKALRSAMQKRGHRQVPWAEKTRTTSSSEKLDPQYLEAIDKWQRFKNEVPERFHYPCYYDAWRMGLWTPGKPDRLLSHTDCHAQSTRNVRFNAEDVEKEIMTLAANALKQLPALSSKFKLLKAKGWPQPHEHTGKTTLIPVAADTFGAFLCYGPAGEPFASYAPDSSNPAAMLLRQGSNDDWMGVLGQKIPRFDNRILDNCCLLPRYHVCKVDPRLDYKTGKPFPESLLASEVVFLMKLKNTLVQEPNSQRKLTVQEIRKVFEVLSADIAAIAPDSKEWASKIVNCFSLSKSDWLRKPGIKELTLRPLPGHEVIKAPKETGRSRFSRPVLKILKELILSGESPEAFARTLSPDIRKNQNEQKGLVIKDLQFLRAMGFSWEDLYIPSQTLESLAARHTRNGKINASAAIAELLGSITDPVVRHRLSVFTDRLRYLHRQFGVPEKVALEFVREDFMGPKRKAELLKFQAAREKARKEAREQVSILGLGGKSAALKYELLKAQGGICIFTGKSLSACKLNDYEIEHIVPRNHPRVIGPDAMINYVLTTHETNREKTNQTPYEWFHKECPDQWDGYLERVKKYATTLRNKKVQLLTSANAPELVERYTALAETAWISKLAQTVVSLYFGWKNGCDAAGHKRITIVSGGLTGRLRRKFRLNSILNPCPKGEDEFLWEEKCEKNRNDDRHHALDAMIISFIPDWVRNPSKTSFFQLPKDIKKRLAKEIVSVVPRNLCYEKPTLKETIYGARQDNGQTAIVNRVSLLSCAYKPVAKGKVVFDLEYALKNARAIRDPHIAQKVVDFLATHPCEKDWRDFCSDITQTKWPKQGARILKVSVYCASADEYKDLSKDGTGAWRHGDPHKGQIIYHDPSGKLVVRPVYAHDSIQSVKNEIRQLGKEAHVYAFVYSGCTFETMRTLPVDLYRMVDSKTKHRSPASLPLPPGKYMLNTLMKSQGVEFTSSTGQRMAASLKVLVEAGMCPCE